MVSPHAMPIQFFPARRAKIVFWTKVESQRAWKINAGQRASIQGPTGHLRACPSDSGMISGWICHPILSGFQTTLCSQKLSAASVENSAFRV